MLFNSFQFGAFFAVVFAAFVALPRAHRPNVLLVGSLLFYALWVPAFVLLLFGTLSANHALLRRMTKSEHRRAYLAASVALTLLLLGSFKYLAFAAQLAVPVIPSARSVLSRAREIALPLGISFYSFEIISVAVDVYRGRLECPRFRDYALFVTFFPHLIAGPIMRGNELLPQLVSGGERTRARTRRGVWLFAVGLVKKTVLSDYLLLPFITQVYAVPGAANGPVHLVALYSFAFQIYFDFSGYTDMARGLACILGFELPRNFEEPYLSRDMTEFWRRWHMTLSRWLRDYLYVPLGGNRSGLARTFVNLMITMLLGGLWHGAGLNFVAWGAMHGAYLGVTRLFRRERRAPRGALAWSDVPAILLTFHLTCLAWIPFRLPSWSDSTAFVRGLLSGGYLHGWPAVPLAVVLSCVGFHCVERIFRPKLPSFYARLAESAWGPWVEGAVLGSVLSTSILASGAGVEFVYFRF